MAANKPLSILTAFNEKQKVSINDVNNNINNVRQRLGGNQKAEKPPLSPKDEIKRMYERVSKNNGTLTASDGYTITLPENYGQVEDYGQKGYIDLIHDLRNNPEKVNDCEVVRAEYMKYTENPNICKNPAEREFFDTNYVYQGSLPNLINSKR